MRHLVLAAALAAAVAAGGCESKKAIEYVTIAQEVRPAVPAACRKKNPPRPVLAGGQGRAIAGHIERADKHIDTLESLRDECRAGLGEKAGS